MTTRELYELIVSRGWTHLLFVDGVGQARPADNYYEVGRDSEGWRVAFVERGETSIIRRHSDEAGAVADALEMVKFDRGPGPGHPVGPAAKLPGTSGRVSSWTLPKPE